MQTLKTNKSDHQTGAPELDSVRVQRLARCREKAAQAWCAEATKNTVMDTALAEAFAEILRKETDTLRHYAEWAWSIIANAGGGDLDKETQEWQQAAAQWRDEYHAAVSGT